MNEMTAVTFDFAAHLACVALTPRRKDGERLIPKSKGLPKYADDSTLNQIRGKAMVGHQSIEDVWTLLDHLQLLEHVLDEEVDPEDGLGPSGWREHMQSVSAGFQK